MGMSPNPLPRLKGYRKLTAPFPHRQLYSLYLIPAHHSIAAAHYVTTRVPIVNAILQSELRAAAEKELQKTRPGGIVDAEEIMADAEAALAALSEALGTDRWFFGGEEPGVVDANVFGYTHLILTLAWNEPDATLKRSVQKFANLAAHEDRMRRVCGW